MCVRFAEIPNDKQLPKIYDLAYFCVSWVVQEVARESFISLPLHGKSMYVGRYALIIRTRVMKPIEQSVQ